MELYLSSATAKHSSRTRISSSCFQSCKLPPLHECLRSTDWVSFVNDVSPNETTTPQSSKLRTLLQTSRWWLPFFVACFRVFAPVARALVAPKIPVWVNLDVQQTMAAQSVIRWISIACFGAAQFTFHTSVCIWLQHARAPTNTHWRREKYCGMCTIEASGSLLVDRSKLHSTTDLRSDIRAII